MLRALIFLLLGVRLFAATYYIRTDGNNSNAGTTNSAGGAWLTVQKAASTVVAGDRAAPTNARATVITITVGN